MNKLCILIILVIGCSFAGQAQEKRDTIHARNVMAQRTAIRDELGLSKEQAKKLKGVNQDFRSRMQTLKSDSTLSRQQRRERSRNLLKERDEQVDKILTPDQQKKFHEMERQRANKRKFQEEEQ